MRKFTEKDIEEKLGIGLTELFGLVGKDAYLIIAVITCILAIISTILMIIELKEK